MNRLLQYMFLELVDYLVSSCQERLRHGQAKCFGGLEIDYQLVLSRCLNWHVFWLFALENAVNVTSGLTILIYYIGTVATQSSGTHEDAVGIDCRQSVPGGEGYQLLR